MREAEPVHDAGRIGSFDLREALARMDGDWELFREVAGMFAADSRAMMARLCEALAAGDAASVGRAAHAIKGTVANFGARGSVELARELEDLGKRGELVLARENCAALQEELERLRTELTEAAEGAR